LPGLEQRVTRRHPSHPDVRNHVDRPGLIEGLGLGGNNIKVETSVCMFKIRAADMLIATCPSRMKPSSLQPRAQSQRRLIQAWQALVVRPVAAEWYITFYGRLWSVSWA